MSGSGGGMGMTPRVLGHRCLLGLHTRTRLSCCFELCCLPGLCCPVFLELMKGGVFRVPGLGLGLVGVMTLLVGMIG